MKNNEIKVFIVDDHEIFRAGLKRVINRIKRIKVVGEASNGEEFLEQLDKTEMDIVFMDIEMPVLNGIEATKQALIKKPALKVAALTMFNEDNYIQSMLDAGAKGFLLKNIGKVELNTAIDTLEAGNNYFSEELWSFFSKKVIQNNPKSEPPIKLTRRQKEILQLICEGVDNTGIAGKLFISERTVIGHKSNLLAKTECKNTASLISYAVRNKLVKI